jgi:DNA-binding LacI/PurR family transcriptional regulator
MLESYQYPRISSCDQAGCLRFVLGERLTCAFEDPQAARFLSGVAEVCAAHACLSDDPDQLLVAVCPHNSAVHGEALTHRLLADEQPPDAMAAMSDELALNALHAAEQTGAPDPAALCITG